MSFDLSPFSLSLSLSLSLTNIFSLFYFAGLHGILRHREKKLRKEIDHQEDADVEFSDLEALRKLLGSFGQVVVSPKASSSDEDDSRSDQSDTFPALGNGNNNLRAFLQHNSSDKNGTKWSNLV